MTCSQCGWRVNISNLCMVTRVVVPFVKFGVNGLIPAFVDLSGLVFAVYCPQLSFFFLSLLSALTIGKTDINLI